uniref:Uncharacterized protein n=1 Tax=virus sp. ctML55 TaxID=2827627 RepID=A0A8S5RHP0_9VIRU|nr:MAG TPA: hypothetical protein [virus sp. ctML55]
MDSRAIFPELRLLEEIFRKLYRLRKAINE